MANALLVPHARGACLSNYALTLVGVCLMLVLESCHERDYRKHSPQALLREILMEERTIGSDQWTPLSRMDYSYNQSGQDTAKQLFLWSSEHKPILALSYQIRHPSLLARIELRSDCNLDSCHLDTRRSLVTDNRGDTLTDSLFSWNPVNHNWKLYRHLSYTRDTLTHTDTTWITENRESPWRLIGYQYLSSKFVVQQRLDSTGAWQFMRLENRIKPPQNPLREVRWYDQHGHWIGSSLGDHIRIRRFYQ